MLPREQLNRYHRHLLLPEIGIDGQEKLLNARVLIVGLGGLGCPASLYLAAAGVGRLGLVDFDRVDASNLQRQVLYTTGEIGQLKVEAAARRLHALNPDIAIEPISERLTVDNAERIFSGYDYIVDGSDNFATRYLVNDACVLFGKINIYGSIFRFEGQAAVLAHPEGPCYRCLFPVPPRPGDVPNCAEAGVLGVLPGQIGTLQATETIKLILGIGDPLIGRLMIFDALDMSWRSLRTAKDPDCAICGSAPSIRHLIHPDLFCGRTVEHEGIQEAGPQAVSDLLGQHGTEALLLDVREPLERQINPGPESSVPIPLGELTGRLGELEHFREKPVIAYCAIGVRSMKALEILKEHGFTNLINMTGGLARYEQEMNRR
jgi:adenylyltransferase/sulfurtransferase